jgi:hypothetical protein
MFDISCKIFYFNVAIFFSLFLIYTLIQIIIGINYSRKIFITYNKRKDIFGCCAFYPDGLLQEIIKKIPIYYEEHRNRYHTKFKAEKSGYKILKN